MSRPSKYSEALQAKLCEIIETGCTIRLACDAVGITTQTYNEWNKNNLEFADAVKRARATGAQNLLSDIKTAGRSGTWQASAWILERSYHEHFGRQAPLPPPQEDTKVDELIASMNRYVETAHEEAEREAAREADNATDAEPSDEPPEQ